MKRKNMYVAAGLGLVQLALPAGGASAQEQPVPTLNEVVVTASRSPKKQSEIGKVVRVINAEALSKSQGRTLTEVLNNVAGLTIGGNGNQPGDVKSVYLRGAAPGNTLILIDGIPVNDASGVTGEYNISAIPVDQVARIEILKGGNSTLYGSDAVAGVINIITKKGKGALTANVLATGGSDDTYKQGFGLNGQIQRTAIALNASNLQSKGFSAALPRNGQNGFDRDNFKQRAVSLNLDQQAADKLYISADFQANDNRSGLDGGAFADTKNYTYDKSSFIGGAGGRVYLNGGSINLSVHQNEVKNLFNNNSSITDNRSAITQAEANFNYSLASFLEFASGLNYKYSETRQKSPFGSLNADNNIKSVFASLFFKAANGFNTELGGRYNDHSQYGDNFTYTVNPSYVYAGKYKIFANISSAYRVPSLYQLYAPFYGNTELKPETTTSYEAGFSFDFLPGRMNLGFSYFRREIRDVIDFAARPGGAFGYVNQNKQKDRGFEAEIGFKPVPALNITGFYAFVDGEITTPVMTSFNLFRRPKHSFGATAALALGDKVDMNFIYKLTGKHTDRYYDSSIGPFGATAEQGLSSYSLLDVYVQFRPAARLALFSDLKNVLNKDYTEFVGYTTRGFNFNAGVRYEIR